jgi:hypothetical protein
MIRLLALLSFHHDPAIFLSLREIRSTSWLASLSMAMGTLTLDWGQITRDGPPFPVPLPTLALPSCSFIDPSFVSFFFQSDRTRVVQLRLVHLLAHRSSSHLECMGCLAEYPRRSFVQFQGIKHLQHSLLFFGLCLCLSSLVRISFTVPSRPE